MCHANLKKRANKKRGGGGSRETLFACLSVWTAVNRTINNDLSRASFVSIRSLNFVRLPSFTRQSHDTIRISLGLSRNFKPADKQTITLLLFTVQPRYLFIPEFAKFSQKFRACFNLRADFVRSASSDTQHFVHDPKQNREFVMNLRGTRNCHSLSSLSFPSLPLPPFKTLLFEETQ